MASSDLTSAYTERLRRALPADVAAEIEDGLADACAHYRARGRGDREAAEAAIAEFGDYRRLAAELTRHAPGRRAARLLLASGPIAGACWATALATGRAWAWPVPLAAWLAFAAALLIAITLLVSAAAGTRSYRRTRLAVPGGIALITLDTAAVTGVLAAAPTLRWAVLVAVAASLARIAATARSLRRIALC